MTLFVQGEQECCDLTWPSLPRWRTFKVNDNKSHFPDSSGHTCTEKTRHTPTRRELGWSPQCIFSDTNSYSMVWPEEWGTAPRPPSPSNAPCSSKELGVCRADREAVLKDPGNNYKNTSYEFLKCFEVSWNRQSKRPGTSNRKCAEWVLTNLRSNNGCPKR